METIWLWAADILFVVPLTLLIPIVFKKNGFILESCLICYRFKSNTFEQTASKQAKSSIFTISLSNISFVFNHSHSGAFGLHSYANTKEKEKLAGDEIFQVILIDVNGPWVSQRERFR